MPLLFLTLAVVLGVGFVWLIFTSARRGSPQLDPTTGTMHFRHSKLLRAFAVFALFGAELLFALWALLYPPKTSNTMISLAAGAVLLGLAGGLLLWETFRWSIFVAHDGLDCRSPWKGRRVIPWEGVKSVGFSPWNAWFVLDCVDGVKFRVPALIPGVRLFLEQCEKHLQPAQLGPARGGYAFVGRKWPQE